MQRLDIWKYFCANPSGRVPSAAGFILSSNNVQHSRDEYHLNFNTFSAKETAMLQASKNQVHEMTVKSTGPCKGNAHAVKRRANLTCGKPWERTRTITMSELQMLLGYKAREMKAIRSASLKFPMKIPQYYADLMIEHAVLRPVVVPSAKELIAYADDAVCDVHADESQYQPVEGIVHRYPGKLLFLPTLQCFGHCRFCFRSGHRVKALERAKIDAAIAYIRRRRDVREVLVTGGDPLVLPLEALEEILSRLRAIDHVQIIRIGTRAPAYAPQVITRDLADMLARYKPVFMSLSFVHPAEVTAYCEEKLNLLADAGIVMLQQGPLLKGINDDPDTLRWMYEKLAKNRVLAYYAIYGIFAPGIRHFIVDGQEARRLLMQLENTTSGYCLPHMITLDQKENKTRSVA
jgi:lysine 2,3-aminomutase